MNGYIVYVLDKNDFDDKDPSKSIGKVKFIPALATSTASLLEDFKDKFPKYMVIGVKDENNLKLELEKIMELKHSR